MRIEHKIGAYMDRCEEYKGGLTREQFLFYEIRVVAKLLCEGCSKEEAKERIVNDNLFQFPTERMVSSIANTCLNRIEILNSDDLVKELAYSNIEEAKLVNLYAMMRTNKIVWDFMITVIGEKFRTQDFSFGQSDINIFMMRLQEQNDDVASWSDSTISKIKQVLRKSLVEAGYLDSNKSTNLNSVLASYELIDGIKANTDNDALIAFNYFG